MADEHRHLGNDAGARIRRTGKAEFFKSLTADRVRRHRKESVALVVIMQAAVLLSAGFGEYYLVQMKALREWHWPFLLEAVLGDQAADCFLVT